MSAVFYIEIDLLTFLFGLVMLINLCLRAGKLTRENQQLILILGTLNAALLADALAAASLFGHSRAGVAFSAAFTFVYYVFSTLVPFEWFYYVYRQVYRARKVKRPLLLALPLAVSLLLIAVSPFTGIVYRVSADGVYSRGGGFAPLIALCYFYILAAAVSPVLRRRHIERKRFLTLIMFTVPPVLGSVIQFSFSGLNLIWPLAMLSILLNYLGILSDRMNIDYLTGLFNRMQADICLANRIAHAGPGRGFAGIMIDVDRFKEINDHFGHHAGDEALESTARLLKNSIGRDDFLARVGGDEFLIVLATDNMEEVRRTADVIERAMERYNKTSQRPYELRLSMGYDVYRYDLHLSRQQFFRHIDRLMYQSKNSHHTPGAYGEAAGN